MPVVCDFSEIVGDRPVNITPTVWERNFNTGGRTLGTAFLIFSVSGLTSTRVFVRVNNVVVGEITPNQSNLTW
ncbi:hypothetical protein, partial [Moorena sp. SIO4G3]|uniref:hypothetical protein n=1 Tax=Moorena sp. SIO4G3 TaxID=2607821 RepID=UPI00142C1D81